MPSTAPIGLVAPWWRDYNKAVADGKVTKAEVKTLLKPHADQFDDPLFRQSMEQLATKSNPDAKATVHARKALNALLHPAPHWPTNDQLARIYGRIANSAVDAGAAKKLASAPRGYEKAPSWNITPKGMLGSSERVYLIGGKLFLATAPVVPNAKTTWFDCGYAPLF